ncbi:pituitary tumor-transforming gene 1 protein-interacting protein [Monodelphis domestica]|uniref:pituitary tumor-transforming gene 1 protein-interacting protein n=1 Tax=Monodelphis domestica TaxID=13616 RepID=UPI0000F2C3D0|nr:pituitary tumor-transforming gene 1 protein-interacting protein [Monodelphis domestica]
MLSGELGRGWVSASLAVGLVLPSCLWVAETTKRLLMEPPGPFRAALVGPLLLLLLPLLLPLSGPAVSAQSAAAACSESTNRSCNDCLRNVSCFWCYTNNACLDYPVRKILPPSALCPLKSARWGVCWVNFEALIIAMSVVGGILLLGITVCCCCCCRKRKSQRSDKEEERAAREREERKVRQEERRAEMKSRHEEIRKKYGLFKEQNPYARFENN